MDVGFNNRNMFEDERLKDVVFIVDISDSSTHILWQEWSVQYFQTFGFKSIPHLNPENSKLFDEGFSKNLSPELKYELDLLKDMNSRIIKHNQKVHDDNQKRVDWKQEYAGFATCIGEIKKRPIYVEFSFAYINGHKIAFYNGCSELVDYKMVENYMTKNFQLTHDNYCRWNHVNAANFHNCVNSLDRMDKKPRNTKYKG